MAGTDTGPAGTAGDDSGFPTASFDGGLTREAAPKGPSAGSSIPAKPDLRASAHVNMTADTV